MKALRRILVAGSMKKQALFAGVIAFAVALLGANVLADTAANIEQNYAAGSAVTYDNASGDYPVITAIMSEDNGFTTNGHTYSNWAIIAQDSTGSIDLFGHLPSGSTYTPTVGDKITVAGAWSPFQSIPEMNSLTSISAISSGNALPPVPVFTIPQLNTPAFTNDFTIAGTFLELDNVSITNASANNGIFPKLNNFTYILQDGSGSNMVMFWNANSYSVDGAMISNSVPTGLVDVRGIMSAFNGTPEIIPYSITAAVPEPSTVALVSAGLLGLIAIRRRRG
jgi:hypothetical protein